MSGKNVFTSVNLFLWVAFLPLPLGGGGGGGGGNGLLMYMLSACVFHVFPPHLLKMSPLDIMGFFFLFIFFFF